MAKRVERDGAHRGRGELHGEEEETPTAGEQDDTAMRTVSR